MIYELCRLENSPRLPAFGRDKHGISQKFINNSLNRLYSRFNDVKNRDQSINNRIYSSGESITLVIRFFTFGIEKGLYRISFTSTPAA